MGIHRAWVTSGTATRLGPGARHDRHGTRGQHRHHNERYRKNYSDASQRFTLPSSRACPVKSPLRMSESFFAASSIDPRDYLPL